MGVPKFFRWMSERYPAISQLIAENRIPEFDCLYLDMNGIIHNCTHNDSDSPTFRMTEDKMFIAIFNYIEHLFGKIKPKQLFFMAIDGVAPRAKMNQQRARRFRTALDAERAKEKAIREGVQLPKEAPFDSNCITPGTEFMAKLTRQLKYFINKKVSEDLDWQGVEVVLSGHEVPGEGEHKIMEYIRLAKAQPNYDPNMRHCLYGLDADLIMLGLLSHDPHFCLLREEVTFGRQSQTRSKELEHQKFYLMHICIVREYLELEFQDLKDPKVTTIPFDLERIIDDFILMAFFVGNDFLPNLPNLHINEGALALMFKVYKSVLPKAGGYINEAGVINLGRLALLLDELADVEYRFFEADMADAKWFKGKQLGRSDVMSKKKVETRSPKTMSTSQKELYELVKQHLSDNLITGLQKPLDFGSQLAARDRKFIESLADDLHLQWRTVADQDGNRHLRLEYPARVDANSGENERVHEESDAELLEILTRYEIIKVADPTEQENQDKLAAKYEEEFQAWKNKYYVAKFNWGLENAEGLRQLTENYVQGLQWVLFYYYRGIASWPWFYAFHYSPMISDIKKGLNASMDFSLGQPFRPYQQLMGVLPDRSKSIVPEPYHDLMTNPKSSIIDFYPREFELDMNGKKMEWEAVVKIPFIEESRLLQAMATKDHLLTPEEKDRNSFGVSLKFSYAPDVDFTYLSSLPGVFPDLTHCRCVENVFDLPTMDGLDVFIGLVDGVKLGTSALAGFPSLKTLPFRGALDFHGVNVFQQDSRGESMVVTILNSSVRTNVESAKPLLGQRVFVGYPFLSEAKVVRVSDELFDYFSSPGEGAPPVAVPHSPSETDSWRNKKHRIEATYSKRLGVVIGEVESLVHVQTLKGLQKTDEGATRKEYAQIEGMETDYATQMIVREVISEDQRFLEKAALPIEEEFPEGSRAFFLGDFNYGRPLEIVRHVGTKVDVWISIVKGKESEFGRHISQQAERLNPYTPSYAVARMLGLNPLVLSKITSSFQVVTLDGKVNLGLNLKFEARKLKVLGYSRRGSSGWEFSNKAIELLQQYMVRFPHFIAAVQQNPQASVYSATELFPGGEAQIKIKEIQAWLKIIESKGFEKVPLDAEQLDSEVVMEIERAAHDATANGPPVEGKRIRGVPRYALLKPSDAEHRLGNQRFSMGDRVVYVQDSGRVPIATRGTVVGLTRTARTILLDVVFDVTFMSGTSLNDRCSPFHGSTVPISSVLNITDRQVIAGSRATESHRMQNISSPGTQSNLNSRNQSLPTRKSFRGAHSSKTDKERVVDSRDQGGKDVDNSQIERAASASNVNSSVNIPRTRSPRLYSQVGRSGRGNAHQSLLLQNISSPPEPSTQSLAQEHSDSGIEVQSYNSVPPPEDLGRREGVHGRGQGRGRGWGLGRGRGRGVGQGRVRGVS